MGGNGQIWESGSSGTLERPAYPHQGGSKIPGWSNSAS